MASGRSFLLPHDKSNIKMKITSDDFGPLHAIDEQQVNNFLGGTYYVTTPKSSFMPLYRLCGENAGLDGQYWKVDKRSNESYRHDMAVERNREHTIQRDSTIMVPEGTLMFKGYAAPKGQYLGGGWQVFIPHGVLQQILEINQIMKSGIASPFEIERKMKPPLARIDQFQGVTIKKWNEELIKRIEASTDSLISSWRMSGNMPEELKRIMDGNQSEVTTQSRNSTNNRTYIVCKKEIKLLNGASRILTLSVRKEFVRSVPRTYQSGQTIIHETINYYNLIKEWK